VIHEDIMNIPIDQVAFSVPHAAKVTDTGQTRLWEAIRRRDIQAVRLGRRTLIPAEALRDFIARLPPARPDD
jgi:excisionase family DNA binding protein